MDTNLNFNKEKPKYNKVQYIGFSLPTGNSISSDNFKTPFVYNGLENVEDDWKSRCSVMEDAIRKAAKASSISKEPNTMKIFMAPEFFFRGQKGAYDLDTCAKITERLKEIASSEEYKDWLFVFGTTMGYSLPADDKSKFYETYNYSLIQKGGPVKDQTYIVLKENMSDIDFVKITDYMLKTKEGTITNLNTKYITPAVANTKRNEEKVLQYDSNGIFTVDGIRFGMEICLDHVNKRLWNASKRHPSMPIDVQLVPSSGVGKYVKSRLLAESGIVLHSNGKGGGFSKVLTPDHKRVAPVVNTPYVTKDLKTFKELFAGSIGDISIYPTHELKFERNLIMPPKNPFEKLRSNVKDMMMDLS